ncbi:MAG: hypothetical protein HPY44_12340 [Armatimonadetes bacterium]|nr:hypothetical protein [Armatimonadota bacterium]
MEEHLADAQDSPPHWPRPEQVLDCNCLFGPWPRGPLDASLGTVSGLLGKAGIGGAVVGSLRTALGNVDEGNLEVLRACASRPTLLPAAGMMLRQELSIEKQVAWCAEQGFLLLRLFPDYEGWPMDFRPFEIGLRAASEYGLSVLLTVRQPGELTVLGRMVNATGASVIAAGVNTSHTPLVSEVIAVASDCPGLSIETSRLEGADTLDIVAEALGPDRLVFGTGLPFQYPSSALALVACSRMTQSDRQLVLRDNLLRLIGRTEPGGST